ncbi:LytR/AlgR family response regulator transcription factor [Niabella hibiscisoli]|uniref:LytR/AlgR family response regulator transcription factor n=1 Tax=Niabella hibiscisoli TaxID=1825928 RepID=UPI001F0FDB75|nr:response regulator [Niabella hibiscisoli]MCH5721435.1 response regulator [Niabella hibiscisoli]
MRTIIIDDERLARAELNKMLRSFPDIDVVDEASNAEEAIEKIASHQPELIFLDIQMPGKTGFEMLTELEWVPKVIFTTAFDEYALKAFEVNALDYLLKPIDQKRLEAAIKKIATAEVREQKTEESYSNSEMLTENSQVFVKDGDRCWFIKLNEVRLFESVGNYAKVFFGLHKPLILKSLNALEERLDPKTFFRANRKHIINLHMVEKIEPYFNNGLLVELRGGEKIEISRRQTVKFKEKMSF